MWVVFAQPSVQTSTEPAQSTTPTLYDKLGGIFGIAGLIDHFSDSLINNPIVGKDSPNPQLSHWHTSQLDRLPGLKFMRTLWVAALTGGPFKFQATRPGKTEFGLEEAHRNLKITSAEFDEVARILAQTLDQFKIPEPERSQVLGAFAAHKSEVTAGAQ